VLGIGKMRGEISLEGHDIELVVRRLLKNGVEVRPFDGDLNPHGLHVVPKQVPRLFLICLAEPSDELEGEPGPSGLPGVSGFVEKFLRLLRLYS